MRLLVGVVPAGQAAQRGSTLYFQVAEIGAVHATLKDGGVPFTVGPHVVHRTASSELWLAEFQDPFGNPLALMAEVKAGGP